MDERARFHVPGTRIRGAIVRLKESWRTLSSLQDASPAARRLLGEALSAVTLLATNTKLNGKLTLHLQEAREISLLLCECTGEGKFRGIIHERNGEIHDFPTAAAGGKMAVSVEQRDRRYQSIVEIRGESLREALEHYFRQSEQLNSNLRLATDHGQIVGILVQELPGSDDAAPGSWQRVRQALDSLSDEQLLREGFEANVRTLATEGSVWLGESKPLEFSCPCTRERVERMLRLLGREESFAALEEAGRDEMIVRCEFCNLAYRFDRVELTGLFYGQTPDERHGRPS